MKLLIAEDDHASRQILERKAIQWGYEPIAVENGEDAWEIMQLPDHPELLLLDWEMPKLSGLDLCKRLREKETEDPVFIIFLTSRNTTQDIVIGLEAGSNDYVVKPFKNAELQVRLQVGKRMLELQATRREAERAKARLQRELQQRRKMEALGHITGGIAHDFNNILGIIMGYTNMSLDRYGDDIPTKMKGYLKTVMESSERAKDLVAKLLYFTKMEENHVELLELSVLVEENIERLNSTLPDDISIEFTKEDNLPSVIMEQENLRQLLSILFDNAKDAMEGGGTISVDVSLRQDIEKECSDCHKLLDGNWIELSVSDTGSGMSADTIVHIYEPFYTTKDFGKGMGMAMFHSIVCRHGRHSLIDSTLGEGSKISILFPVADTV